MAASTPMIRTTVFLQIRNRWHAQALGGAHRGRARPGRAGAGLSDLDPGCFGERASAHSGKQIAGGEFSPERDASWNTSAVTATDVREVTGDAAEPGFARRYTTPYRARPA